MKIKRAAILLMAILLMAAPAMAMDVLVDSAMEDVNGQSGLVIAFGSTASQTMSFRSLSWGDPDGVTGAATAGYLRIVGTTSVAIGVAQGQKLTLNVATASGTGSVVSGVTIPASKSFLTVGLPTTTITVGAPAQWTVGLSGAATTVTGTLGYLTLQNLAVSVTAPTALYIYAY